MPNMKFSDLIKVMIKSWFGLVATLIFVALVGGCVLAFGAGNIAVGAVLAVITVAYTLALIYLILWAWIVALVMGTFLSAILGGLGRM